MKQNQKDVKEFMAAAGQSLSDSPIVPNERTRELRVRLLLEEVLELAEASGVKVLVGEKEVKHSSDFTYEHTYDGRVDIVGVADACCDIEYVNQGAALAWGLDLDECWDEVHRSNMSKFIDGYEDEETGKWVKGPWFSPANLAPLILKQT